MIIAQLFLAAVGLMYVCLAIWCSVAPQRTAEKVGFTLNGDSGKSEFITVYGGLELAMSMVFLLPLLRDEWTRFSLLTCLLVHGSLVAFRSVTLLRNRGFGSTTRNLAIGEWVVLAATAAVWWASGVPMAV